MSTPKKRGRPSKRGTTGSVDSPPSLPPAVGETGDTSSSETTIASPVPAKREYYKPPRDMRRREFPGFRKGTKMWENLQRIIAMQVAGVKTTIIAETLGISPQTCRQYLYNARKQGIIEDDGIDTAKDHLELQLVPKAVQNLYDALHDDTRDKRTGLRVADQVALEVTKGVLFKEYGGSPEAIANNAIQINVVMPPGPEQTVREGAISGVPAFVDGDVV